MNLHPMSLALERLWSQPFQYLHKHFPTKPQPWRSQTLKNFTRQAAAHPLHKTTAPRAEMDSFLFLPQPAWTTTITIDNTHTQRPRWYSHSCLSYKPALPPRTSGSRQQQTSPKNSSARAASVNNTPTTSTTSTNKHYPADELEGLPPGRGHAFPEGKIGNTDKTYSTHNILYFAQLTSWKDLSRGGV